VHMCACEAQACSLLQASAFFGSYRLPCVYLSSCVVVKVLKLEVELEAAASKLSPHPPASPCPTLEVAKLCVA
jgi:hypothetical protein